VKNNFLVKKPNKRIKIKFVSPTHPRWSIQEEEIQKEDTSKIIPRGKVKCQYCQKMISLRKIETKKIGYELQAICGKDHLPGKRYFASSAFPEQVVNNTQLTAKIQNVLKQLGFNTIPKIPLKPWSGVINPPVYGYENIEQVFTQRQKLVLLTLIHTTRDCYQQMVEEGLSEEKAEAALIILSSLVEHLVDWNNSLTMWIPQNEQTGRSLAGPGLPMRWEFVEINPFASGPANLYDKLKRISSSLAHIPKFDHPIEVIHGDATNLPFKESMFDIIITDPPYFDNLFYSALSDLFTPWFTLLFHNVISLFEGADHSNTEITSAKHIFGSFERASKNYQGLLTKALTEMHKVLRNNGQLILIYNHKTLEGWATMADAIVGASFTLVHVLPLQMERKGRPQGMKTEILHTTMILVLKKQVRPKINFTQNDLENKISSDLPNFLDKLKTLGLFGSDLAASITSFLVTYYSQYSPINPNFINFEQFYEYSIEKTERAVLSYYLHTTPKQFIDKQDELTQLYLYMREQCKSNIILRKDFELLCREYGVSKFEQNMLVENEFPFVFKNGRVDIQVLGKVLPDYKDELENSLLMRANKLITSASASRKLQKIVDSSQHDVICFLLLLSGVQLHMRNQQKNDKFTREKKVIRKVLNRIQLKFED
jgi:hypothetical protein